MCVCVLVQDSRFIKVPHFSDVPVDVHLSVQEKLTPVTDALSRVSKLVCEDLERAVQLSAGQDKEGEERSRSDAKRTQTWLSEIPSFRLISCYYNSHESGHRHFAYQSASKQRTCVCKVLK